MKATLKNFIPPIIFDLLKKLLKPSKYGWKGNYKTWQFAEADATGYDADNILKIVKSSVSQVKSGLAIYERDSVIFNEIQYSWPLLTSLLLVAARNSGELSVLDFGGSLGSSYYQNKKFLDCVGTVKWGVVEQQHFIDVGRKEFEDERLKFFKSIGECVSEINPKVLLLSSVLQYLESPYDILDELVKNDFDIIIVDRTPFSYSDTNIIKLQVVPPTIYSASYPCRFFNRSEFNEFFISSGYKELETFPALDGKTDECEFLGIIYKRNGR